MINVKLRRKGGRRNKIVLSVLVAFFGLAVAIFSWFAVQNAPYRQAFADYRSGYRAAVTAVPGKFEQFRQTQDVAAQTALLNELSASLSQKIKDAPSPPALFGWRLGVESEQAVLDRIKTTSDAFTSKLKEESAFISHQATVGHTLQTLSLKTAGNYDQIVSLAAEWQQSIEFIKQTAEPAKLTDVSASLLQKMASTHAIILQLGDLYKAHDETGFTAKQKELAAATASFKTLAEQITAAATSLDTELAQAFAALKQNL